MLVVCYPLGLDRKRRLNVCQRRSLSLRFVFSCSVCRFPFSNTAFLSLSIEAIENAMNASSYDVYTLDGQAVMLNAKSLKGLKKGAYIINDRKFILK